MQINIIGAGVIGSGVAQLFAQYGHTVFLIDTCNKQLEKAKQNILNNLRHQKILKNLQIMGEPRHIINNITFTDSYSVLKNAEFIIENITENWQLKKSLYLELNNICSTSCFFGVNTSAISITKVASLVKNPDRVVGMHFMNPVPMMPMVEVIKGYHTSESTLGKVKQLLGQVDRQYIIVNDSIGFVTNRAMMIFVNEAIFMLQEGVASVEEIDTLFRQCFGHKMGPLQTADLIGLDTVLYSLEVLYEELNDPKYRPCWLLKKMVNAGTHGEKTKKGFYTYT